MNPLDSSGFQPGSRLQKHFAEKYTHKSEKLAVNPVGLEKLNSKGLLKGSNKGSNKSSIYQKFWNPKFEFKRPRLFVQIAQIRSVILPITKFRLDIM